MPREIVRNSGPFVVKVGWSNGDGVQLGVETDDGRSVHRVLCGNALEAIGEQVWLLAKGTDFARSYEDVGRAVLDVIDSTPGPNAGVWADLSRADCNRLIHLLRRARDAAYGADA